jgi:hypothetical protein
MTSKRPSRQNLTCAACRYPGKQDYEFPTLCWSCGNKIRLSDRRASDISGIRREMKAMGVPMRGNMSEES